MTTNSSPVLKGKSARIFHQGCGMRSHAQLCITVCVNYSCLYSIGRMVNSHGFSLQHEASIVGEKRSPGSYGRCLFTNSFLEEKYTEESTIAIA